MSSREKILTAIRTNAPAGDFAHPGLDGDWIEYDDPAAQFAAVLQTVGGECRQLASSEEAQQTLAAWPPLQEAKQVCSLAPELVAGNVDLDVVNDPHDLAAVDFAVLRAEFAVAENAAVWTTDAGLRHRVLPFLTQHLAIVVPAGEVLSNMYQAYRRLSFDQSGFGAFVSGPSKTADIEQSLVIGAHGARSLLVLLVGS